jgi:hypothetical protein
MRQMFPAHSERIVNDNVNIASVIIVNCRWFKCWIIVNEYIDVFISNY